MPPEEESVVVEERRVEKMEMEGQSSVKTIDQAHSLPQPLIDVLSLPHVRMADASRALRKVKKMVEGGADNLIVISDFDHTLSRAFDEQGERSSTAYCVFESPKLERLQKKCRELVDKYLPIEFCDKLTIEEKIPHMEEWWTASNAAIVEENLTREEIEGLVRASKIKLRDGAEQMLSFLEAKLVPLVIFSAGIGDVIFYFLSQHLGTMPRNTHLVSNMMRFDEKGVLVGFEEPLIHTFNKNGSVIKKEAPFFHEVSKRGNVILLGDSMGDLHMDVGVEHHNEKDTLKIAFLNKKEHLLPYYLKGYDIVIIDDQSMVVPQAIFDAICGVL